MTPLTNIEIIAFMDGESGQLALVSYQDPSKLGDLNNGYSTMYVPVNLRPLQYSAYGNLLVDQSVKAEPVAIATDRFDDSETRIARGEDGWG